MDITLDLKKETVRSRLNLNGSLMKVSSYTVGIFDCINEIILKNFP